MIAALDTSHECHDQAAAFIERAGEPRLVAHVALEAYHVLTRVRPYRRLPPRAVASPLRNSFPGPLVGLPLEEHWALVERAHRNSASSAARSSMPSSRPRPVGRA